MLIRTRRERLGHGSKLLPGSDGRHYDRAMKEQPGLTVSYVGHATVLLDLEGVKLLTDPLLRSRVAHLRRAGKVDRGALRGLDAVLVSHLHYDHLDLPSLQSLGRETPVIAPKGAGALIRRKAAATNVILEEQAHRLLHRGRRVAGRPVITMQRAVQLAVPVRSSMRVLAKNLGRLGRVGRVRHPAQTWSRVRPVNAAAWKNAWSTFAASAA